MLGDLGDTYMSILNCLAVRLALAFLLSEDNSKSNKVPSYGPFSGVLPLMCRLNFIEYSAIKNIRYRPIADNAIQHWSKKVKIAILLT
jgi:hypothetical protein